MEPSPIERSSCWLLKTLCPGSIIHTLCVGRFADAHRDSILVVRGACLELWPPEGGEAQTSQQLYAIKVLDAQPLRVSSNLAVSRRVPNRQGYFDVHTPPAYRLVIHC